MAQLLRTEYLPKTAIFIDDEKTVINVDCREIYETKDVMGESGASIERESVFTRTVTVDPNPIFEEFIEQISLDQVEENTVEYRQAIVDRNTEVERAITEEALRQIRKELLPEIEKLGLRVEKYKLNAENSTSEPGIMPADVASSGVSLDMTTEELFKAKLQCFEIDAVKNSKNRDLKSKLRKAQSFMEVVAYTSAIVAAE